MVVQVFDFKVADREVWVLQACMVTLNGRWGGSLRSESNKHEGRRDTLGEWGDPCGLRACSWGKKSPFPLPTSVAVAGSQGLGCLTIAVSICFWEVCLGAQRDQFWACLCSSIKHRGKSWSKFIYLIWWHTIIIITIIRHMDILCPVHSLWF